MAAAAGRSGITLYTAGTPNGGWGCRQRLAGQRLLACQPFWDVQLHRLPWMTLPVKPPPPEAPRRGGAAT
jgi:hypothetical protein